MHQQQQPAGPDPLIGLTIGNYRIKSKLGEGGMGSVYLAEHPLIGKQVALKILHQEFATNKDVVQRFFTEAKAVNDIQHPNIVDIVDYGELHMSDGTNMVYFIMEFLNGRALAQLVRDEAPLAPERALSISLQIADALSGAHSKQIVHRDLKPDNVILLQRGRQSDFVKVLDFGIAKLTGDQPGSRRTRTGIVMGTPAYMSPEQCEGRGNIDHRTDIYALGILLYELLTGRVPFVGDGYGEILVQHLTQQPARPSTIRGVIPPHVEMVCLKALEKRPEDRYPSMDEFMRAMADPVGYVESHGGLDGYLRMKLSNTGGPVQAPTMISTTPTPNPLRPLTPLPGTLSPAYGMPPGHVPTPGPGQQMHTPGAGYMPSPTPFPTDRPAKNRMPLIIAVALLVIGLGVGAFFLFGGGGGGGNDSASGPSAGPGPETPETPKNPAVNPPTNPPPTNPPPTNPPPTNPPPTNPPPTNPPPTNPPPVVNPPVAEEVEVKITSTPAGADVYVGKEKKSRGQTPASGALSFKIPKGTDKVTFTLRKDGFKSRELTGVPDQTIVLDAMLEKRASQPVGPTGPTGHPPGPVGDGPKEICKKTGKPGKCPPGPVDDDEIIRPGHPRPH